MLKTTFYHLTYAKKFDPSGKETDPPLHVPLTSISPPKQSSIIQTPFRHAHNSSNHPRTPKTASWKHSRHRLSRAIPQPSIVSWFHLRPISANHQPAQRSQRMFISTRKQRLTQRRHLQLWQHARPRRRRRVRARAGGARLVGDGAALRQPPRVPARGGGELGLEVGERGCGADGAGRGRGWAGTGVAQRWERGLRRGVGGPRRGEEDGVGDEHWVGDAQLFIEWC